MTREEAIDIIKCLAWHTRSNEEDVEQAIKALQQEPCIPTRDLSDKELKHFAEEMKKVRPQVIEQEPCDDCISRKAAIDELELQAKEMSQWSERYMEQAKGVLTAKNIIKDLLPATLHPKTGHWIEGEVWEDTDGGWGRWQKCSVCRQSKHHKTNFCPNCGAKMEDKE